MKPTTRPMTADEAAAARCLCQPTYPVASFDKRFAASAHAWTKMAVMPAISEKAAVQIWRIFHRYRRQISCPDKARLLQIAEARKAPDYRNPINRKAQEQQAEIDRMKAQAAQEEEAANAAIAETANDVLLL